MLSSWIYFLRQRFTTWRSQRHKTRLSASGKVRIAVRPPTLQPWVDSESGLYSLLDSTWLDSSPNLAQQHMRPRPVVERGSGRITPLPAVRNEFLSSLQDLPGDACDDLENRIRGSRSLRELWHLRAELFKLVAVHRDQHAAQQRLTRLNRHFPSSVMDGARSNGQPLRTAP
ncbi:MAG: hypothetical protein HEQ39_12040 [Rhizobacter sp.]